MIERGRNSVSFDDRAGLPSKVFAFESHGSELNFFPPYSVAGTSVVP